MADSLANRLNLAIFDGINERPPWLALVRELRQTFSCSLVSLVLRHSSEKEWNGRATSDADWDLTEWNRTYLPKWVATHPYPVEQMKPGRCYADEDLVDFEGLRKSSFFREVLVPTKTERFLCLCLGEPQGYRGWLYLSRSEDIGQLSVSEREELCTLIAPLQSALHLYARIMMLQLERDLYQDSLARMGIGTIILDQRLSVLNIDHIAEELIRRNSTIRVIRERPKLATAGLDSEFLRLCRELLAEGAKHTSRALKVPRDGMPDLQLLLRRVARDRDYGRSCQPALAVFINDPSGNASHTASQVLIDLFGLTHSEAVVASLLAQGHSIKSLAQRLHISQGTARSHLKRVFSKVGVNRQGQLVHLIGSSLPLTH